MTRIIIHGTLNGTHHRHRSMEDVSRNVAREAKEECTGDCCTLTGSLDTFARQMVFEPWPSRVRSFVPLLTIGDVCQCIPAATCEPSEFRMKS